MTDHKNTLPDHILFGDNHVDFWVFAYGSLMWQPDFDYSDRRKATLEGYSRALCIYSWVHRGTREAPGLVFGLDEGGRCEGFAFQIPGPAVRDTVAMLRKRELVTNVYQEVLKPLQLTGDDPRTVMALFYSAVRTHEQYAGTLSHDEQLRFVRQGVGQSGVNTHYVLNTHNHLQQEGIQDEALSALCRDLSAPS